MKIQASTFAFLEQLKLNNEREWFQQNKELYDDAHKNVKEFVEGLIIQLSKIDPYINLDIKASKCMFRIYRDVRFSKDKSPYKNWLAAGISIDGRKLDGPEYYIHIEPNKSFIAVGYWQPKKEHLDAIRQELDYNYNEFLNSLEEDGWSLADLYDSDKLVRPPAGYTADNPAIETLKFKSFIIHKNISNIELIKENSLVTVVDIFKKTQFFKKFLHEAIES